MMNILPEKTKTRNVKNFAVAQWLRNMPDQRENKISAGQERLNIEMKPEKVSNITIKVAQESDVDDQLNEIPCNNSSLNACSTRPLSLHGNKCSFVDSESKQRRDASGNARRVKFDVESQNENTDNIHEDVEKHVKFYDVIIRTAEEDHAVLKRSMTQFLKESSTNVRKEKKSASDRKSRSYKYITQVDDSEHREETVNPRTTVAEDRNIRSRKSSSIVTKDFDDIIFENQAIRTATSGLSSPKTYSVYQSGRSGFSAKRCNRQRPKKVYLKYLTGTEEVQTPVIKGLVVDVVDNQKPSVVRASKNANIREEFALRQKVEGYRAVCSQSISRINLAQRKLCGNLLNLKKKKAALAQAEKKQNEDTFSLKTMTEELFHQSKGYFPETRLETRTYNFPALSYPKRRVLTIN